MYQYKCTVVNVIDGDTVDAVVDLGFNISIKMRFRLSGINAPEMKSDTMASAKVAKSRVSELVLNKSCSANTYKPDKYGRWLAEFIVPDTSGNLINVNQTLLKEGLAIPYID